MALFFPNIKGCNFDDENATPQLRYTTINFIKDSTSSPTITKYLINGQGTKEGEQNLGSIVTTEASYSFNAEQKFNAGLWIGTLTRWKDDVEDNQHFCYFQYYDNDTWNNFIVFNNDKLTWTMGPNNSNAIGFSLVPDNGVFITKNGSGNQTAITNESVTAIDLIASKKCQAVFFNATSDYRAKSNIKYLDIDALDLINKVQLYSFNYKDSNEPSIGVIAQDLMDLNIGDFSLVDNKDATGVKGDYMRVKESKLTYILWKAVQELSEKNSLLWDKIYKLEARIAQLEQK